MWWRRSWFSLKGKAGIPGQTEGRPTTSIGPRVPPVGSLQQRAARPRSGTPPRALGQSPARRTPAASRPADCGRETGCAQAVRDRGCQGDRQQRATWLTWADERAGQVLPELIEPPRASTWVQSL